MSKKISEMISATTLNGADIIPLVDTGDNNKTTSIALLKNYMIYNVSATYNSFNNVTDLMNWFITMCTTMNNNDVRIVAFRPNFSSQFFAGAYQTAIVYRVATGVYRVAFPHICGDAYYYSNAWHYTKATMSTVTPD